MTTYAISHKKLTRTIRLELDEVWLVKNVSMNLPPFKFDGVDDFECEVECSTKWSSWWNEFGVFIRVEAKVLNPAMQYDDTLINYFSYQVDAEIADGKEVRSSVCLSRSSTSFNNFRISEIKKNNCIVDGKVIFIITATYLVPEFIDNSVRKCKTQFQPFELVRRNFENCDVKFVVAGSAPIFAHKAFLSLVSPVFAAMFDHDTKEAQTGIINITDFDHHTVNAAIDLLYGHPFEPDSNEAVNNVSRFAGKYLIDAVVNGLDILATVEQVKPKPRRNNFWLFCLLPVIAIAGLVPLFKLISAKFL